MRSLSLLGALALSAILLVMAGCVIMPKHSEKEEQAKAPPVSIPTGVSELLIWSSAKERPGWTMEEPSTSGGIMSFVGLSDNAATEPLSREQASRNTLSGVVRYMGTLVKDKFEKARTSFGLSSSVEDPTVGVNAYEKQLSVNMSNQVKMKTWYTEKWQTQTGIAYRTFVLAQVPEQAMQEASKKTAGDMARKAEQQAKEAADDIARDQAKKAADFWKQMRDQGVTE